MIRAGCRVGAGLLALACGAAENEPAPGLETGPCIANTCRDGFVCHSDVCVVPEAMEPVDDDGVAGASTSGAAPIGDSDAPTSTTAQTDGSEATDTASLDDGPTFTTSGDPSSTTGDRVGCGDGVVQAGEACDGTELQGLDCGSLDLGIGALSCDPVTCMFDTSACEPIPTPDCHPFGNDCPPGSACYASGNSFTCQPPAPGGGTWADECTSPDTCAPYYACVPMQDSPILCDTDACCVAYCTVGADSCGVPVCVPVYAPGTAPAGFENLGVCVL